MDSEDRFDKAVRWALTQPHLQGLMRNTYVTYDTVGDAHRFYRSKEFEETVKILSRLGKGPDQNYWLVDVGAGNGIASYAFAKLGYQVVAVDSSPSEIAGIEAAKKLQGLDGVNFELKLGDITALGLPEGQIDVIYGRQFFHHTKDLDSTLAYLATLLKPGGVLCAIREHVVWSEKQRERFLANHPLHHITQSEGAYYLKEYRGAFYGAGLSVRLELDPYASVINTFPQDLDDIRRSISKRIPRLLRPVIRIKEMDALLWRVAAWYIARKGGQLYSFFVKKGGR
jgi:2-polyprenyl-3-methyl-5-hydroxy-6-metoxy-1,4-benzoquinol methylase